MKTKIMMIVGLVLIAVGIALWTRGPGPTPVSEVPQMSDPQSQANSTRSEQRVPAFYETPPATLPPTLPPDKFIGKTLEAYKAVRVPAI